MHIFSALLLSTGRRDCTTFVGCLPHNAGTVACSSTYSALCTHPSGSGSSGLGGAPYRHVGRAEPVACPQANVYSLKLPPHTRPAKIQVGIIFKYRGSMRPSHIEIAEPRVPGERGGGELVEAPRWLLGFIVRQDGVVGIGWKELTVG